jgi:hypothetical protein
MIDDIAVKLSITNISTYPGGIDPDFNANVPTYTVITAYNYINVGVTPSNASLAVISINGVPGSTSKVSLASMQPVPIVVSLTAKGLTCTASTAQFTINAQSGAAQIPL